MISLKNVCLSLIAEEFERFHLAFVLSKNDILKRNLAFLQRKYSYELVTELYQKKKLKDEYLDIFLNKHLKILDCDWLDDSPYEYYIDDVLHSLPNLEEIYCSECNDVILENIVKFCPKVIKIWTADSSITDIGITYLCKNESEQVPCPELKELFMELHNVADETIEHLIRDLPSLERLDLYRNIPRILYSLHKGDLPNLENIRSYNFVNLEFIEFQYLPYYNDLLKICLTVCPKVREVSCLISNKEQLHLLGKSFLESIWLKFPHGTEKLYVNDFIKHYGHNMINLSITNCIISISELATCCPKLIYFWADNITLLHSENSQIDFDCLIKCSFGNMKDDSFTNKAIGLILSSSPSLEKLEFWSCILSLDTKMQILKYCENNFLKEIYFFDTKVEIEIVKHILVSCTSLTSLVVNGNSCNYRIFELKELITIYKTLSKAPNIYIRGYHIRELQARVNDL